MQRNEFEQVVLKAAQERVEKYYRDEAAWAKSAMLNVANAGKFSSDRTIEEYAKDIWKLTKVKVGNCLEG